MNLTKMHGRKMALTLALMVTLGAFTGCGGEKKEEKKTAAQTPTMVVTIGTTGLTPGASEQGEDKNKDGGVQGAEIDTMKEVAKRNNWEIKWRIAPISALFGMLDNGQIDTIANSIAVNKTREEKYNFDSPYAYGSYSLVAKKGKFTLNTMDSVKGKSISVLAGADQKISLEDWANKNKLDVNIMPLDDNGAVLQAVINGSSDIAFIGTTSAALANKSLKLDLQIYDPGIRNYALAHPFRKGVEKSDKIREAMDKTIKEMRADGSLKAIYMKWFGVDITYNSKEKK